MNENIRELNYVVKNWYLPLILGVIFIAVAVWVILTPHVAFVSLALVFSTTFIFTGVLGIVFSILFKNFLSKWAWFLAAGIVDLLMGVILIQNPRISTVVLTLFVGFVFLYHSVMTITWSLELKKHKIINWERLLFTGILGAIFSFLLLNQGFAQLTLVFYTSFALLTVGISEVYFSLILLKLNSYGKDHRYIISKLNEQHQGSK